MTPHIVTSGGWITIVPANNIEHAQRWARFYFMGDDDADVTAREATPEDLLLFDQLADSIRTQP
jgi:hypothetical protein